MAISYGKQITFSAFLLQDILDPTDKLIKLSEIINWERVHDRLRPYYSILGRQGLPIRLMVGLHLLKHHQCYMLESRKTLKTDLAPAQKMSDPNMESCRTRQKLGL